MGTMTNSMKKYVDPAYIVTKAIFLISHQRSRGHKRITTVLVEGSYDKKLYKLIANHSSCVFVTSDGKQNAIEALTLLLKQSPKGVIAIIDDDYDSLQGKSIDDENIIVSDTHDIETMIFASPALTKYLTLLL